MGWNGPIVLVEQAQPFFTESLELLSLLQARLAGDAAQGRRIEIVVCKNDVPDPPIVKFVCFLDDLVGETLPWLASIGHPHRTETAVLGASGNGLHRGKHVLSGVKKVPARFEQYIPGYAPSRVSSLQSAIQRIPNGLAPDDISIAGDNCVGPHFQRLVGKYRRVNASHD